MKERTYLLYSKRSGQYEIVPTGYSLLAATLGMFWAAANGLLGHYFLLMAPMVPLVALGKLLSPAFLYLALVYLATVFFYYFPSRAFAWRASRLEARGFKLQASLMAGSSAEALRKYAAFHPNQPEH